MTTKRSVGILGKVSELNIKAWQSEKGYLSQEEMLLVVKDLSEDDRLIALRAYGRYLTDGVEKLSAYIEAQIAKEVEDTNEEDR